MTGVSYPLLILPAQYALKRICVSSARPAFLRSSALHLTSVLQCVCTALRVLQTLVQKGHMFFPFALASTGTCCQSSGVLRLQQVLLELLSGTETLKAGRTGRDSADPDARQHVEERLNGVVGDMQRANGLHHLLAR